MATKESKPKTVGKPKLKLILVISVDQMRDGGQDYNQDKNWWGSLGYLERFSDLLRGGFKTLSDENKSRIYTNTFYRHSCTGTGPGHATIMTGMHPTKHGIVANEWYDRKLNGLVKAVEDPNVKPVGSIPGESASPHRLQENTLGDYLKAVSGDSKVVSIAIKDRAAILMGAKVKENGHSYWFDAVSGSFITSTYYRADLPQWLKTFNDKKLAKSYSQKYWKRSRIKVDKDGNKSPDKELYEKYAREDDFNREYGTPKTTPPSSVHRTFPHFLKFKIPRSPFENTYDAVIKSPFGDILTAEMVKAAVAGEKLGQKRSEDNDITDILTVGFSALDLVGHLYGPRSQECMDVFLSLDDRLGDLLNWLTDKKGGKINKDELLVVLTADHGVIEIPEYNLLKNGTDAHRIHIEEGSINFVKRVRDDLKKNEYGDFLQPTKRGKNFFEAYGLYLDLDKIHKQGRKISDADRTAAEETLSEIVLKQKYVEAVYTRTELLGNRRDKDGFVAYYRNSYVDGRSPDVLVRFKENYYVGDYPTGTGHGTPYEYDRGVPMIFHGPSTLVTPGKIKAEMGPDDIAPILAKMLGINAFPDKNDKGLKLLDDPPKS